MQQKPGRAQSVIASVVTVFAEDRRLVIGALLFAAAAVISYAVVRHFGLAR